MRKRVLLGRANKGLNIGCGNAPKKGYTNIDLFNTAHADLRMDASYLDFKDDTFKVVDMRHVIEHLGFVMGIHAISEAYRVLKKRGQLIIETPDIEKTFELYVHTKNSSRKAKLLNWIYGLEFNGYQHVFCFPKELLVRIISSVGFKIKKISDKKFDGFPAYQITAIKISSNKKQLFSHLRKAEYSKLKLCNLDDYLSVINKEKERLGIVF